MFNFLNNFRPDRNSFLLGFLAATLFWWLIRILRPLLLQGWQLLVAQFAQAREGLSTGIELRLANDVLRRVQGLHIAAPLFSLDEVRIPPGVGAPPARVIPGEDPHLPDIVERTVPYMPDWPELAGMFGGKTFSLPEAMQTGVNLLLLGRPGMGKTFAMADLASRVARRRPDVLDLAALIPVHIHAYDLDPDLDEETEPLDAIIDAVSVYASALTMRQLPRLLQSVFRSGRVLLLLDGLDEMAPRHVDRYVRFLGELLGEHPNIRLVIAASTEYYGELRKLGLEPVPMAAWDNRRRIELMSRWSGLWQRYVNPEIWPSELETPEDRELPALPAQPIDPRIIDGWLLNDRQTLTPLELTLKLWSAYAGDMRGVGPLEAIEAYLLRTTLGAPQSRPALEDFAMRMAAGMTSIVRKGEVDRNFSANGSEFDEEDEEDDLEPDTTTLPAQSIRRSLSKLVQAGILVEWSGGRVSFAHPLIFGYLAGRGFAERRSGESLITQPKWIGRSLALQFLSACGELSPAVVRMMEASEEPLIEELMEAAGWLKTAPKAHNWRTLVMRRLAKVVQNELYAATLRGRALAALATSSDQDIAKLFRHMLNADSPVVRTMGALGAGYVRDSEVTEELAVKLYDPSPEVRRAACLALVHIGSERALEQVAAALLHGDEDLRRAAAEAFANHPEEGYPLLRDGARLDDLLVRRAVVFGLERVKDSWALELLKAMQIEDEQWVVRNAATQAIEELEKPDPQLPRRLSPPHEAPWLIAFAGDRGIGITSGKPAKEMLRLALKEGKIEQKLAALPYIHYDADTGFLLEVYHLLYGGDPELKDSAFNTLWHLNAEGVALPSPTQYGLGT